MLQTTNQQRGTKVSSLLFLVTVQSLLILATSSLRGSSSRSTTAPLNNIIGGDRILETNPTQPSSSPSNPCSRVIAIANNRHMEAPTPDSDAIIDDDVNAHYDDNDEEGEDFLCEMQDGRTLPLGGSSDQINELCEK